MIFAFNNLGDVGIIKDVQPHELPPNAWSDGNNVHFVDGFAAKTAGYQEVFASPDIAAYGLLPLEKPATYNWLQMGTAKVYVFNGSSHFNITRQTASVDVDYTGGVDDIWTSCVLGGLPILNNGVDTPQMWNPAETGTRLSELSNWPAGTTCKVMRNYKQFLLALNLTKSSVNYPTTLKWSHPADPLTVPVSWDETDPTRDSGEYTFSETGDFLVDAVGLRDVTVVYKENTVWGMQFIGGTDIFRFSKLFSSFGALGPNCATEFLNGKHLVLAYGDIIVHDGQNADSILTKKQKRWLNANINGDAVKHCFVVSDFVQEEVLIAICTGVNILPDTALIWNWRTGALGMRSLPLASFIASGLITNSSVGATWDEAMTSWDDATLSWSARLYSPGLPRLLMAVPAAVKLYSLDTITTEDGVAQLAYLERTGISVPFKQQLLPDFTARKFLRAVWPRIQGSVGSIVKVYIGTQQTIGGNVTWQAAQNYTIGTTKKINCLVSGRLFALKFESTTALSWSLHGYELDIVFSGGF